MATLRQALAYFNLKLSDSKCEMISFGMMEEHKKTRQKWDPIKLVNTPIPCQPEIKLLGTYMRDSRPFDLD